MRYLLPMVCALTVPTSAALAQARTACAQTPAAAEQQVRQLETEWQGAFERHDPAALERILADDFLVTGGATTSGKVQFLANIRDPARSAPKITISDERYRAFGDVVVVTGLATYSGPQAGRERYTEVFACRDGKWQAVHGHYNTLAPAPDSGKRANP